jgi:hypothetical protein
MALVPWVSYELVVRNSQAILRCTSITLIVIISTACAGFGCLGMVYGKFMDKEANIHDQ